MRTGWEMMVYLMIGRRGRRKWYLNCVDWYDRMVLRVVGHLLTSIILRDIMKDEQVLVVIIMRLDEGNDFVCSCLYFEWKFLYFIMMDVNIHSSDLFRTLYIDCGYC